MVRLGYQEIDEEFNFTSNGKAHSLSIVKEIGDFISALMEEKETPESIRNKCIRLDIQGLDNSPWVLNFKEKKLSDSYNGSEGVLNFKMNVDTMLALMHQQLNISMSFREGLIRTNASYKELNEIGKFIFG